MLIKRSKYVIITILTIFLSCTKTNNDINYWNSFIGKNSITINRRFTDNNCLIDINNNIITIKSDYCDISGIINNDIIWTKVIVLNVITKINCYTIDYNRIEINCNEFNLIIYK